LIAANVYRNEPGVHMTFFPFEALVCEGVRLTADINDFDFLREVRPH